MLKPNPALDALGPLFADFYCLPAVVDPNDETPTGLTDTLYRRVRNALLREYRSPALAHQMLALAAAFGGPSPDSAAHADLMAVVHALDPTAPDEL